MKEITAEEMLKWVNESEVASEYDPIDINIISFMAKYASKIQVDPVQTTEDEWSFDAIILKVGSEEATWNVMDGFEYPWEALHALWAAVELSR